MSRQTEDINGLLHKQEEEPIEDVLKRGQDANAAIENMAKLDDRALINALRKARGEAPLPDDHPI